MASPHYQAAKGAVKDALRAGLRNKKSDADVRQDIQSNLRALRGEVRGDIRLTRSESSLQAELSVVLSGRLISLNVSKERRGIVPRASGSLRTSASFNASAARELILSLKPGDKVKVVFADRTFGGNLGGRLFMLLGAFRNSVDFGGELAFMNLASVAESGSWSGFREYLLTIREDFDAAYFVTRTIDRELLENIERA